MHRILQFRRDWMRRRSTERMSGKISGMAGKARQKIGLGAVLRIACAALALPLVAQQRQGPLPPPPPGTVAPSSAPAEAAKPNASRQETSSHITNEPPPVPVQQIIQKFTEHEEEFRQETNNFTSTQLFEFQQLDDIGVQYA